MSASMSDPQTQTVWLHGAGLSAQTWEGKAEGLCLDLPGHAGTPRVREATVAGFAEALLPHLSPRCALVGHSLGGMIGLHLAATQPERITRFVFAESAFTMQSRWIDRKGAKFASWLTAKLGPRGTAKLAAMGEKGAAKKAYLTEVARMDPAGLNDAMAAAHSFDGRDLIDRIHCPVLILTGRRNPRTHKQALDLARRLPGAKHRMLEGGHMLHKDVPGAFYGAVQAFLAEEAGRA
ncbi:alpha/beta fold hydrolase [Dinoroseobacter sp. S76]|uniref:alpha/beta fold hydrolase n=1 Tax=Dinoroseobacter sp. S76 TaxID=3415124 RepID=UPI003C7E5225